MDPVVLNGFPHIVYHWTLEKHMESISVFGLMRGSFVTQDPRNYKGEVLLGVCMDKAHDWERMKDGTPRPDDATWQAVLPEPVPPERIFRIQNPGVHPSPAASDGVGGATRCSTIGCKP